MTWWWLSFCDGERPEGQQFLGVAIVGPAAHMVDAVRLAHYLEINPGGEVQGVEIPDVMLELVPVEYRERLLDREAAWRLDSLMGTVVPSC